MARFDEAAMHTLDLDYILSPCTSPDFVARILGQEFLHIPGRSGKFGTLFSWSILNHILGYCALGPPRLSLVKEGQSVVGQRYLDSDGHVSVGGLMDCLQDGATLTIRALEELHQPIRVLMHQLERILKTRVGVNLYAGWRGSRGFDTHWDDHDVIILQIAGRKYWQIYGETDKFPLRKHSYSNAKLPEDRKPVWEGMLNDGDALYLPRGWWHVAIPREEPTLHLTVGMYNPTGMDLVKWCTEKIVRRAPVRMDIPRLGSSEDQNDYMLTLQKEIAEVFVDPNIMNEFLLSLPSRIERLPAFSLPLMPRGLLADRNRIIVVPIASKVELVSSGGDEIDLWCEDKVFTFDGATTCLLEFLRDNRATSIEEFLVRFEQEFILEELLTFLSDLVQHGIISIVDPNQLERGLPK